MNLSEDKIDRFLRQAPEPQPPDGLRDRLVAQIDVAARGGPGVAVVSTSWNWLRRWRLAVAGATLAVASLVVSGVQQARILKLEDTIQQLRIQNVQPALVPHPERPIAAPEDRNASSANTPAELQRLRTVVADLNREVESLETLRAESVEMKARIAAQAARVATAQEIQAMTELQEKAQSIACINNMKQLGLAGRIWSTDNGDVLPPDILSMSNELATTKILICPADVGRTAAPNWQNFTAANSSYQFVAPSGSEIEPQRVMFICPVHGHITLCDGSVQSGLAKHHPERLKWQPDGSVYLDAAPGAYSDEDAKRLMMERYGIVPPEPAPQGQPQMSEELMRRYGLTPEHGLPQGTAR